MSPDDHLRAARIAALRGCAPVYLDWRGILFVLNGRMIEMDLAPPHPRAVIESLLRAARVPLIVADNDASAVRMLVGGEIFSREVCLLRMALADWVTVTRNDQILGTTIWEWTERCEPLINPNSVYAALSSMCMAFSNDWLTANETAGEPVPPRAKH